MINIKKIFRVFRSEESYENFLIQNTELNEENSYSGFKTTFPSLVIVNTQVFTKVKIAEKINELIPTIVEEQEEIKSFEYLPVLIVENLSGYDYNILIGGTPITLVGSSVIHNFDLADYTIEPSLIDGFGIGWEKTLVFESTQFDRFGIIIKLVETDGEAIWEVTNLMTGETYFTGKTINIELPHEEIPIEPEPEPEPEEQEEWGEEETADPIDENEWGEEQEIPGDDNHNGIPDNEEWNTEEQEEIPEETETPEEYEEPQPEEPQDEETQEWGEEPEESGEESEEEEWGTEGGNPIIDDEWG